MNEAPPGVMEQRLNLIAACVTILSSVFFVVTLRFAFLDWLRTPSIIVAGIAIAIYLFKERRPFRRLISRLRETFVGASKWDVAFDMSRIAGLAIVFSLTFGEHGISEMASRPLGKLFVAGVAFIFIHPIYRFFRSAGMWDSEYKRRNQILATALNYASLALETNDYPYSIIKMEMQALFLVKSYLEYAVSDRDKSNFNANLIVKDPAAPDQSLLCIQRSDLNKPVPKSYPVSQMKNAMQVFETGEEVYLSKITGNPDYRMVWLMPIRIQDGKEVIGVLEMNSRKSGHLDLEDERQSLRFNINPYISLLGYTLTLRRLHKFWH